MPLDLAVRKGSQNRLYPAYSTLKIGLKETGARSSLTQAASKFLPPTMGAAIPAWIVACGLSSTRITGTGDWWPQMSPDRLGWLQDGPLRYFSPPLSSLSHLTKIGFGSFQLPSCAAFAGK